MVKKALTHARACKITVINGEDSAHSHAQIGLQL